MKLSGRFLSTISLFVKGLPSTSVTFAESIDRESLCVCRRVCRFFRKIRTIRASACTEARREINASPRSVFFESRRYAKYFQFPRTHVRPQRSAAGRGRDVPPSFHAYLLSSGRGFLHRRNPHLRSPVRFITPRDNEYLARHRSHLTGGSLCNRVRDVWKLACIRSRG